ncbi:MAG: hypothetical protein KBD78_05765 [Oligoflexales bacterium]|nr:hypothetical protein [Oligoflexales bacterium]
MSLLLKTQLFFDKSKLDLSGMPDLPDDIFALLGKNLSDWIKHGLKHLNVKDAPLILSDLVSEKAHIQGAVYIEAGAIVEPFAYIQGPCIIRSQAQIRHGAYIRGEVYIGPRAVVGHTTEVKGSVFLDDAKAGHFAYVGDSILGRDTNLGAGTKLANLKVDRSLVKFKHPETEQIVSSELKKFGAIMADQAQTGCNAVLNPGTILMQKTAVLPCKSFRGTLMTGVY